LPANYDSIDEFKTPKAPKSLRKGLGTKELRFF